MLEHHTPSAHAPLPRGAADRGQLAALLDALVSRRCLVGTVPLVLEAAERDPLASGGRFVGDLVRGLMEVPGHFWSRHPTLYARYQAVLRANAAARRSLPIEQRMHFWTLLDVPQDVVMDEDQPRGSR